MFDFLLYTFYRLVLYYEKGRSRFQQRFQAYFVLSFVFFTHYMVIENMMDALIFDGKWVDIYFSHDRYTRRFIIAPLIAFPIFLGVYLIYRFNKKRINENLKKFALESEEYHKKRGKKVLMYLISSILLWFASMFSGALPCIICK